MVNEADVRLFADKCKAIFEQVGRDIIGQEDIVELTVIAMIAGGNVLLEGVPGIGKTRLIRSLGRVFSLPFSRIQFTPDLMPADITGTNVLEKDEKGNAVYTFRPGPIFSHIVLATQNPIEQEGTYALPEAQVDRFMFKLLMRYPTVEEMKQIVLMTQKTMDEVADGVVDGETLLRMRETAKEIPVTDDIINYTMRLVSSTQPSSPEAGETAARMIRLGASPRAAQALITCAKVRAMVSGRFNVSHEDIDALACPVLRHRVKLSYEAMAERVTPDEVIVRLVDDMKKKRR